MLRVAKVCGRCLAGGLDAQEPAWRAPNHLTARRLHQSIWRREGYAESSDGVRATIGERLTCWWLRTLSSGLAFAVACYECGGRVPGHGAHTGARTIASKCRTASG
eukprot:11025431-Alexandrium_andersonii.AAC.1